MSKLIRAMIFLLLSKASYAQICQINNISATTPNNRFSNEGAITIDNKTGLMWKRCAEGQQWNDITSNCDGDGNEYNWNKALAQAKTMNNNGGFMDYKDWRIPNISELNSIIEYQCYEPSINLFIFPNPPSKYWSSSPLGHSILGRDGIWFANFDGNFNEFQSGFEDWTYEQELFHIRLVRGE